MTQGIAAVGAASHPSVGSTGWYDKLRSQPASSLHQARREGYDDGEYVGQRGFMTAGEILAMARAAGVTVDSRVLDVCCGTGGPARYLSREIGCRIVGIDLSRQGIRLGHAEDPGGSPRATFLVADAQRLPFAGGFDVVLLLETILAFEDKRQLLGEIRRMLRPGGSFGMTVEEGEPLSCRERRHMPGGDSIWLISEDELVSLLQAVGLRVRQREDRTQQHARTARRLATSFWRHRAEIAAQLGLEMGADVVATHANWARWLANGRVRKLAIVAELER